MNKKYEDLTSIKSEINDLLEIKTEDFESLKKRISQIN